ncbi:MAG: exo-alpha-sialidase, partial [bacterium]|nr:exo-alpha-sialidase [bacterium]
MTTDGSGNWVAVWYSDENLSGAGTDSDILVARSTDNGATWTAPALLNTSATSDTGGDYSPTVTTDGSGNWVAVWDSVEDLSGAGTDRDILVARSTNNGTTWTAPGLLNTNATTDSFPDSRPEVSTDGLGNWVSVWESNEDLSGAGTDHDILVARSTDNGATWAAPTLLNTNATSDTGGDHYPMVTTDGSGNWVAIWVSLEDLAGAGTDQDIFVAHSVDNGATWTAPALLNSNGTTDSSHDAEAQVMTDGSGDWVAVWRADESISGTGTDQDIFVAHSADNGASWAAPALLNTNGTTDSGNDWSPQVASDGSGNWVSVWYSDENLPGAGTDNDIFVTTFSLVPGFSPTAALNTNANTDSAEDSFVKMASDDAGNWVAVWQSEEDLGGTIGGDWDILVATSADYGGTWSAPAALNTSADSDVNDDAKPVIATDGDGTWIALWHSYEDLGGTLGTDGDILFALSTDDGVSWTAPAPVNTNAATDTGHDGSAKLATDGLGNWVAVWVSYDDLGGAIGTDPDILVATSSDDGTTWTAPAALNSQAATDAAALDYAVHIDTDGAGNWVVVWDSANDAVGGNQAGMDIMVSRSSDNGASWTAMAVLNSNAFANSATDTYCTIAPDSAGNWLAVWQCNSFGSADYDILVSRSTDAGATWSAAALLNSNGASDSGRDDWAWVTAGRNGLWRCVWSSTENLGGTLGSDRDLLTAYSWDLGVTWTAPEPLTLNAYSDAGADEWPVAACDGDGNWVAAWHSDDNLVGAGTDKDIFYTAFSEEENAPWLVNSYGIADSGSDSMLETATDGNGNWVAVWSSYDTTYGGGTDGDVMVRYSTNDGATWSAPAFLHADATSDTLHDVSPQVGTDGSGVWVAVWQSDENRLGAGTDYDLFAARSTNNGATWTAPVLVNSYATSDSQTDGPVDLTTDTHGQWLAVWRSDESYAGSGADRDIFAARSSNNGTSWSTAVLVNSFGTSDSAEDDCPSIATDAIGNWVAVWHSAHNYSGTGTDYDVFAARSLNNGATWATPYRVNQTALTDSGADQNPRITTDADGTWVAVWQSDEDYMGAGTDTDIFVARSLNAGASWTFPTLLNSTAVGDTGSDTYPGIAMDGVRNWVAVWESEEDLLASGTDRDIFRAKSVDGGLTWSPPILVNTNASFDSGTDTQSRATPDGQGKWLATWRSNEDLLGAGTDNDFFGSWFTIELIPPTADTITPSTTGPTNADSIDFTVEFSENVVFFDDAADVVVTHTGTAHTGVSIAGGPSTYTVTVEGITGDGSFTLAVDTGSDVQNLAGDPLDSSVTSAAVAIDNTGPNAISITPFPTGPTNYYEVFFDVVFDEPVLGFDWGFDVIVDHPGLSYFGTLIGGFGTEYSVQMVGVLGDGSLTLTVNTASDITDWLGNPLESSVTSAPVVIDHTDPEVLA